MSQIEIRCVDQTAMFTNLPEIFSGDVNIDTVKFTFDDSWNGYTTKTAVFYNNPKDVYPQILDVNDVAVIPSQVMTKQCKLSIGVFGTNANGDVKTSKILTYNVGKGAINSDLESTPATPDFWTQLLARQINFENNINSTVSGFETDITNLSNDVDTVEAIAKGRNQALAYNSYSEMITALNSMSADELKRGQNIYIGTVGVPDLWVYSVETTKSTYTYTNDETIVNGLNNNVTVKVGYYKLAQLETQKVDVGGINSAIDTLQSDVTSLTTQSNDTENRVITLENKPMCIFSSETVNTSESMTNVPYAFEYGTVVLFNNEIHVVGGNGASFKGHYKWNGTSWTSVSTLPYSFYQGCAVAYNNEIHILGSGENGYYKYHYKWNGSSWVSVSTLPYNFTDGCAVVYNGEIHILGGSNYERKHYKWNGSSWENVSTIPYSLNYGCSVVLNGEIHILGSGYNNSYQYHYKYDGSSWSSVSTIPYNFVNGSAVAYNNEIHIFGSNASSTFYKYHYKWNGTSWSSVSALPYNFYNGCAILNKGRIYLLGGSGSSTAYYKLKCGTFLSGYVKANTNLYLPHHPEICTDNLEVIEDGYKVTENGYVEILIG